MNKFFVEIGSADFDTLLPLANNGWNGIIVEPNNNLLDNIRGNNNVIYENIAIHSHNGKTSYIYYDKSLYKYNETNTWAGGVGTTNREMNHMIANPHLKEYERVVEVECLTLDLLLEKHNVTNIDFMKVDVEGSENVIFESYSWEVKPSMIKLESRHWSDFGEYYGFDYKGLMFNMLREHGYLIWEEENDTYAIY